MKTLVLLHGGPGFDDSYFFPFFDKLREQFVIHSYKLGSRTDDVSFEGLVNELESYLENIKADELYIYAHSFASTLIANIDFSAWKKIKLAVLSNWVIDSKWIDIFIQSFPEAQKIEWKNLRQATLEYAPYYFENLELGKSVLQKINYDDELYLACNGIYAGLDLRDKLVSLSSSQDKITTQKYIELACQDIGIKNYNLVGVGHFPFIDDWKEFSRLINSIVSST